VTLEGIVESLLIECLPVTFGLPLSSRELKIEDITFQRYDTPRANGSKIHKIDVTTSRPESTTKRIWLNRRPERMFDASETVDETDNIEREARAYVDLDETDFFPRLLSYSIEYGGEHWLMTSDLGPPVTRNVTPPSAAALTTLNFLYPGHSSPRAIRVSDVDPAVLYELEKLELITRDRRAMHPDPLRLFEILAAGKSGLVPKEEWRSAILEYATQTINTTINIQLAGERILRTGRGRAYNFLKALPIGNDPTEIWRIIQRKLAGLRGFYDGIPFDRAMADVASVKEAYMQEIIAPQIEATRKKPVLSTRDQNHDNTYGDTDHIHRGDLFHIGREGPGRDLGEDIAEYAGKSKLGNGDTEELINSTLDTAYPLVWKGHRKAELEGSIRAHMYDAIIRILGTKAFQSRSDKISQGEQGYLRREMEEFTAVLNAQSDRYPRTAKALKTKIPQLID
tara:strand:- start:4598 stop:5959 length:1362 start_codon:yes stop_codon:yes gene_type:complete